MNVKVLDWSSEKLEISVERRIEMVSLCIGMSAHFISSLKENLSALDGRTEIKLKMPLHVGADLPVKENWILYFKKSNSDKFMAAHPTEQDWIGSFLLTDSCQEWLVNAFSRILNFETEDLSMNRYVKIRYPNNLDLKIYLKK